MGFEKCLADQYLLIKKSENGTIIVCLYINDICCVRSKEAIEEFKRKLKKIDERRRYYGGVHWLQDQQNNQKSMVMYQDMLIKTMF